MTAAEVESLDGFIWCSHACGSGQILSTGGAEPIVRCSSCSQLTCYNCKVHWHEGLTCEENSRLLEDPEGYRPAIFEANARADIEEAEENTRVRTRKRLRADDYQEYKEETEVEAVTHVVSTRSNRLEKQANRGDSVTHKDSVDGLDGSESSQSEIGRELADGIRRRALDRLSSAKSERYIDKVVRECPSCGYKAVKDHG